LTVQDVEIPGSRLSSAKPSGRWTPILVFLVGAIVANALALLVAWIDRSYFALSIQYTLAPGLNLALALASVGALPRLRRRDRFPAGWHAAISLLAPATLTAIDFGMISRMTLHGC
jgi:hypothetical protein